MGVDFRIPGDEPDDDSIEHIHGWSYHGFARFREALAAQLGIDLDAMEGYTGAMRWDVLKPHPLHTLLNHSDCDGDLSPADCAAMAPALRAAVADWEPNYDRQRATDLARLMDIAARRGRPVRFC